MTQHTPKIEPPIDPDGIGGVFEGLRSILEDPLLQSFYWIAGIILAVFAVLSLRQQARHTAGNFLFQLSGRFEDLEISRKEIYNNIFSPVLRSVAKDFGGLDRPSQEEKIKEACRDKLKIFHDQQTEEWDRWILYLDFFETLGLAVKRKYIPLEVVVDMYKGPIYDVDLIFTLFIKDWGKKLHVEEGLYGNLLDLITATKKHAGSIRK